MSKRTVLGVLCGFVLLAVVCAAAALKYLGYSELPDGRGGINVEGVSYTPEMGFDKKALIEGFPGDSVPAASRQLLGMPQHGESHRQWRSGSSSRGRGCELGA